MEEVARNVNEDRRRAEVVKDVLSSKSTKKPNSSVGVAASVNLSKMKSIRHGGVSAATMRVSQLTEGNNEAAQVEALQAELKRIDAFAQDFARSIVDWGKMTSNMMFALRTWSYSFGKVIGLSAEQGSEAFDAFLEVVQRGLMPLATDLEAAINDRVLRDLAHLLKMMTQPFKLIASMNEQEPYHYHLLTMPVNAKNRPPPSLLAASTNYLALRGQLAAELPTYIRLLHKGLAALVRRLAEIQTRFWRDVCDRWVELWEMLRVESELNVGWKETCAVWRARWSDVDQCFGSLIISRPVQEVFIKYMKEREERERQYRELRMRETREARERKLGAIMEKERETERIMRGALGEPPSPAFRRNSSRSYPWSTPPLSNASPHSGGSASGSTAHLTSPSKTSVSTTKAATVYSTMSSLEPVHPTNLPKAKKKDKPVVNVERAMGMLGPASVGFSSYTTSMAVNEWKLGSANEKEEAFRDGGKRGRAFSADTASALNIRRPSSQDGHVRREGLSSTPARPKTGDGQMSFRSQVPKVDRYHDDTSRTPGGTPLSHKPELVRMQSMPLSMRASELKATSTFVDNDDAGYDYYEEYFADRYTHSYHGPQHRQLPHQVISAPVPLMEVRRSTSSKSKQRDSAGGTPLKDRGRRASTGKGDNASMRDTSQKRKSRDKEKEKEKSKERPEQTRKRSGSIKSITSFFTSNHANATSSSPNEPPQLTPSQRDSWVSKPAKYICRVVHPCKPPASVSYYSFPFFMLQEGNLYEVLQEAGHPSIHPNLPLYVDDGEDCLLLCRDMNGYVGWALASFLEPVSGP